jgi:hypothetical protein
MTGTDYHMKALWLTLTTFAALANVSNVWADDLIQFHSPSKNIFCVGVNSETEGGSVDCELITRTNETPSMQRPADCDLEWGSRFALGSEGEAKMICAGDTLRDDKAFNFGYGEELDRFGIHCTSTQQGVECINDDQHGFKISKGKQELY